MFDLNEYKKFLERCIYNPEIANKKENLPYYAKSMIDFEKQQKIKFGLQTIDDEFQRVGCCLNFSTFLAGKFKGMILTCREENAFHCAVVYLRDNQVMVADPALDKMSGKCEHYNIPIANYLFKNDKNQNGYCVLDAIGSEEHVVGALMYKRCKHFDLGENNNEVYSTIKNCLQKKQIIAE